MRFSFTNTCVLSYFLLVTTAAAIALPRDGYTPASLSHLNTQAKKAPAPQHPRAWGKTEEKKLPTKSKEQRKKDHEFQQVKADNKRQDNQERRKNNLAKHQPMLDGKATPVKLSAANEQAALAKKERVQAKAKSTQLEAKERLRQRKEAGRMKFDTTRKKYHATDNLPSRKDTFTTPGGKEFTGADARRAVWNSHNFADHPVNRKPSKFRNTAGPATKPQRVIGTMEGTGTEFPINNHKHGYQGRPQPVKTKGQTPPPENPGPARAILQEDKKSHRYSFQGVVSHDERTLGKGRSAGETAHHHIQAVQKHEAEDHINGDAMHHLFG